MEGCGTKKWTVWILRSCASQLPSAWHVTIVFQQGWSDFYNTTPHTSIMKAMVPRYPSIRTHHTYFPHALYFVNIKSLITTDRSRVSSHRHVLHTITPCHYPMTISPSGHKLSIHHPHPWSVHTPENQNMVAPDEHRIEYVR